VQRNHCERRIPERPIDGAEYLMIRPSCASHGALMLFKSIRQRRCTKKDYRPLALPLPDPFHERR